jgi:tetratricopeptide (TPR) repeat protein
MVQKLHLFALFYCLQLEWRVLMKKISMPNLIFCILMFVQAYAQSTSADLSAIAKKSRPAVFLLVTYDANHKELASGSGFIVSQDGKLITNYHVIEKANSAIAKSEKGGFFPVEGVLAVDAANDLAVLKIDGKDLPFLILGSSDNLEAGARISVIGSPLGLEGTLSEGIISAVREVTGIRRWLQITASISPGSSGSPVFNSKGEVVGVATMLVKGGQFLNFAIAIEAAQKLLAHVEKTTKPQPFAGYPATEDKNILTDADLLAALSAATSEDYTRMLSHAQALVKKHPQESLPYLVVGIAYGFLGFKADAITAYQQAIKLKPDYEEAWNNLGCIYSDSGRTADAIAALQQAIKLEPGDAVAWYNLGVVYNDSKRTGDAIAAYQQAIKLKPDYPSAWYNQGGVYAKVGRITDAIAAYQQAIKLKPDDAMTLVNLGSAYHDAGRFSDAIAAYQRAIKLEPNDAAAWNNLGFAYRKSGRAGDAIAALQQAIKIKPDLALAWLNLANAYNESGRTAEALAALRKAREIDPSIR